MPMPTDVRAIDLMLTVPDERFAKAYEFMKPMLRDDESQGMKMPAQYMFKDIPDTGQQDDYIAYTLERMDANGVELAMIGVTEKYEISKVRSSMDGGEFRFMAMPPWLLGLAPSPNRARASHQIHPRMSWVSASFVLGAA